MRVIANHERDIPVGMYSVFVTGVSCWLVYGLLLNAWPIANTLTLTLALGILVMTLRCR